MSNPEIKKQIHLNIYFGCLLGIAFFLPVFGRIVPPFIILFFLNWLIEAPYVRNFKLILKDRRRLLLASFSLLYLFYMLGMAWSANLKYGFEDLQIKLSLLIFPLVFSTMDKDCFRKDNWMVILNFFVAGCLAGSLLLLGHSWYNERWNHLPNSYYYTNLSWFSHASYLAMYFVLSISILNWKIIFAKKPMRPMVKIPAILLSIFFLVMIVLLSSKAGILSLVVVIFYFSVLIILRKKNWILGVTYLCTSLLILYLCLEIFPFAGIRIGDAALYMKKDTETQKINGESTSSRIQIWRSGMEIIREHPLLGVGTGDVKDELLVRYQKNGIKPAVEMKLNAHSQYIQTFISLGIPGFLLLLALIIFPIGLAWKRGNYLYVIFLLVFALNILFESMLEVQAGVVFYAFFNVVFFTSLCAENGDSRVTLLPEI